MSEFMVARVERAISEELAPAIDLRAPYAKRMIVEAALASIEALRKPTPAMRDAVRPWLADDRGNIVDDDQCDELIEAVIDAALGTRPKPVLTRQGPSTPSADP